MNKVFTEIKSFFKDKDGKWAVIALPNGLLSAWLVVIILTKFIQDGEVHRGLSLLGSAILLTWAYLEVTEGTSNFRRLLGVTVVSMVVTGYFIS